MNTSLAHGPLRGVQAKGPAAEGSSAASITTTIRYLTEENSPEEIKLGVNENRAVKLFTSSEIPKPSLVLRLKGEQSCRVSVTARCFSVFNNNNPFFLGLLVLTNFPAERLTSSPLNSLALKSELAGAYPRALILAADWLPIAEPEVEYFSRSLKGVCARFHPTTFGFECPHFHTTVFPTLHHSSTAHDTCLKSCRC